MTRNSPRSEKRRRHFDTRDARDRRRAVASTRDDALGTGDDRARARTRDASERRGGVRV